MLDEIVMMQHTKMTVINARPPRMKVNSMSFVPLFDRVDVDIYRIVNCNLTTNNARLV